MLWAESLGTKRGFWCAGHLVCACGVAYTTTWVTPACERTARSRRSIPGGLVAAGSRLAPVTVLPPMPSLITAHRPVSWRASRRARMSSHRSWASTRREHRPLSVAARYGRPSRSESRLITNAARARPAQSGQLSQSENLVIARLDVLALSLKASIIFKNCVHGVRVALLGMSDDTSKQLDLLPTSAGMVSSYPTTSVSSLPAPAF
jgi:hypothetical protein